MSMQRIIDNARDGFAPSHHRQQGAKQGIAGSEIERAVDWVDDKGQFGLAQAVHGVRISGIGFLSKNHCGWEPLAQGRRDHCFSAEIGSGHEIDARALLGDIGRCKGTKTRDDFLLGGVAEHAEQFGCVERQVGVLLIPQNDDVGKCAGRAGAPDLTLPNARIMTPS
jgi:hypothetical protein